jgi:hypothetical protein
MCKTGEVCIDACAVLTPPQMVALAMHRLDAAHGVLSEHLCAVPTEDPEGVASELRDGLGAIQHHRQRLRQANNDAESARRAREANRAIDEALGTDTFSGDPLAMGPALGR